jgi:membrane protease YdiL (CAAX protease family)
LRVALVVSIIGAIGGYAYAQQQNIPTTLLWPMLAALVVEVALYLTCGFEEVRNAWPKWALAASAVVPYSIYTAPLGLWSWESAAALLLLGSLVAFWFEAGGPDLLLLAVMAAVYIARVFQGLYPSPHEEVPMEILGQMMWVRIGLISILRGKAPGGIQFGFLPRAREWKLGVMYFVLFAPVAVWMVTAMHYASFRVASGWWYKAPLNFAGIFFVVAASEEVFFRGVLQQRLSQWWGQWAGLVAASAFFGLAHLPYRGFPNWRHAALTFVLALFLGRAFQHARSVRAPMVAHSLTVAVWRTMFS